jgi:hypothetical protein
MDQPAVLPAKAETRRIKKLDATVVNRIAAGEVNQASLSPRFVASR